MSGVKEVGAVIAAWKSVAALAVTATLLLGGCSAGPAPTVTVTATAPTPSVSHAGQSVCDYGPVSKGQMGVIISTWDLVKASRGQSDHAGHLESLQEYIESAQEDETKGCVGSVESSALVFEIALVKAESSTSGEASSSSYENIATAGNAWFDAIGFADLRFSTKPNDSGG